MLFSVLGSFENHDFYSVYRIFDEHTCPCGIFINIWSCSLQIRAFLFISKLKALYFFSLPYFNSYDL